MGTLRLESVCKVSAKVSADCFIKNKRKLVYLKERGVLLLGAPNRAHLESRQQVLIYYR